jgi:ParB family transcriptional regulator, chromosome partitioning protein
MTVEENDLTHEEEDQRVSAFHNRDFVYLPVDGPDAPVLESQARTSQMEEEDLTELISSIAVHGVLQPILVETVGDKKRVVAGERRLRAFMYVAEQFPDNPHIQKGIPAIVSEDSYAEDERRSAQIAENLVRANLSVSELGNALLWVRCSLLVEKLDLLGYEIPEEINRETDATSKWASLEAFRIEVNAHNMGAPWPEVINRLGIEIPPQRAQLLARAVSELPPGVGEEMDELHLSLHSRIQWLNLSRSYPDVADELWEEVKTAERPDILTAAVSTLKNAPERSPSDVVEEVSSAKDRGDAKASEDWLSSKAAAESAALAAAEAEEAEGGDGLPDGSLVDDDNAPSAGKTVGLLRKFLKELDSGLGVTPRHREQIMILCSQVVATLSEGNDDMGEVPIEW